MPVFSFFTISAPTEGFYKEKASKFHAFAFPIQSEADVKSNLEVLKKKFFDASHHCYAYVLGADKLKVRAFDDGEPGHSAGDPILGQIKSRNLTNVLVVVVRYFGGTKLGVGGLISAYKCAAEEALNKSTVINVDVVENLRLVYPYSSTPEIMKMMKEFDVRILSQEFVDDCKVEVEVKVALVDKFRERIQFWIAMGHQVSIS